MTVSKKLIENIECLRKSVQEISVYDLDVYSSMELYYNVAKKLNEVIKELGRFEGVLSEEVIDQNNKLIYLLGEGLNLEVVKKINEMVKDGTMDSIINTNIFNDLNTQIKEKANLRITTNLQEQINNLVLNGSGDSNLEVLQARTSSVGVQCGTLNERNTLVENSLNGEKFPLSWNNWEEGGINTNTGVDTPVSGYLRTVGYLDFAELEKVNFILNNCTVHVLEYSKENKMFIKSISKSTNFELINFNCYYRFVIAPSSSLVALTPTNYLSMLGSYSFKEIDNLKSNVFDIPNIFDKTNEFIGGLSFKEKLNWEIGGINGSLGTDVEIDYAIRSSFYVFPSIVEAQSTKDMYCIAYNQDGSFHSRLNKIGDTITITDVNKKYRFVINNGEGNTITNTDSLLKYLTIKSKETFTENVLNIVNNNPQLTFKKINVLADSMGSTDYTTPNWWQQIEKKTGFSFNNYAISGTCIGYNEERENRNGKCFCNRFMEMDSSADGVVVLGGTNDYEIKLGNWNDSTNETFYGALNVLIKGLLEIYKGKPIIFMTPVQQANDYINNVLDAVTPIQNNANSSVQLQLRAEAIKRKCKQYGVTCIDLYNSSGINGVDSSKIYYRQGDATHLSSIGQNVIANNLLPILESKFKFNL